MTAALARGRIPTWAVVVGLLAVALTLRVGLVLETTPYPVVGDSADFDRHARSIASTVDYPSSIDGPDGGPTAFRPPLYPLFLAGIYELSGDEGAVQAARVVQAVLGTGVVALLGLVCCQLWDRRVALVALVVGALFGPFLLVGAALLSETLFLALVLSACAAALAYRRSGGQPKWIATAGILCGLAALTKTTGMVLVLPLLFAVVEQRSSAGRRRTFLRAATLLAAMVLVVAPWTVRNAIVLDSFVVVSTQGGHTLAGAYNETLRTRVPLSRGVWLPPWRLPDFADQYWRPGFRLAALKAGFAPGDAPRAWRTDVPEPVLDRELSARARAFVADHPLFVIKRAAFNLVTLFQLRGPASAHFSPEEVAVGNALTVDLAVYGLYPVLALAVLGAMTKRVRAAPRWLWLIPLVFLPVVLIDSLMRFRGPIDAFLIVLAAIGTAEIADRLSRSRTVERASD